MKKASKATIISAIAIMTAAIGTAPAHATTTHYDFSTSAGYAFASQTGQTLVTTDDTLASDSLESLIEATSVDSQVRTHGFNVDATIAAARAEIGTSRATGWSMPGECIMSAKRWIQAGGGAWTGAGTPVSNYTGATRLPITAALPGDIIQYEYVSSPDSWATGVHTMLVVGVNDDGTLHIIESNVPYGSGLVTENKSFTPAPPAGFQAVVWRF